VADDGFLFVVDSSRGKILYVSDTVRKILCYSQVSPLKWSGFESRHDVPRFFRESVAVLLRKLTFLM
jgi:hypothetical protein